MYLISLVSVRSSPDYCKSVLPTVFIGLLSLVALVGRRVYSKWFAVGWFQELFSDSVVAQPVADADAQPKEPVKPTESELLKIVADRKAKPAEMVEAMDVADQERQKEGSKAALLPHLLDGPLIVPMFFFSVIGIWSNRAVTPIPWVMQ